MSYFDERIYNVENLKDADKEIVDTIEAVKGRVLDEENLDDFLSQKCEAFTEGSVTSALIKELLTSYANFLKEQIDYCEVDVIIDKIESYSEEELEEIINQKKEEVANNE